MPDNRVVSGPLVRQAMEAVEILNGSVSAETKLEMLLKLLNSILTTPPADRSAKYVKVQK